MPDTDAEYVATVRWERGEQPFVDDRYSRAHSWSFDGGLTVPASSSPHVVPPPYSATENLDPEEAFVASLSSCHMLFFLSFAARRNYVVDEYTDEATGIMGTGGDGRTAMLRVELRPRVSFSGKAPPNQEKIEELHHRAHENCFIANSVKTTVQVSPRA